MNVLVLGANGRLGQQIVSRVAAKGHKVRAFVRRKNSALSTQSVELFQGDATQESIIRDAAAGQQVVINAIGAPLIRNTVESDTTRAVLGALQGFRGRYIWVSAALVVPVSFVFDNLVRPLIFGTVYREKKLVEEMVTSSSLDWTIVRPPRLTQSEASGYMASPVERPQGTFSVSRSDVADFIVDCIASDSHHKEVVFVVSREK